MNFAIQRDPLLSVQKVQSVVEKRNTVAILGNILCPSKDKSSLFVQLIWKSESKSLFRLKPSKEGKITLSAKNFLDIVKELPDKKIYISRKDNNWVELVCGKSKFNIVSLAADEYPSLPTFEDKTYFDARTEALIDMIERTQFAVSTDATRYHLNGVFFEHLENNIMRMTATDGHRLSFVDQEVFMKMPELKRGIIIPKKGLTELRKLLDPSAADHRSCF